VAGTRKVGVVGSKAVWGRWSWLARLAGTRKVGVGLCGGDGAGAMEVARR